MREFKFRTWNKEAKQFTYFSQPSLVWSIMDKVNLSFKPESNVFITEYEELEQFTGIKDKGEVEVYEGDIIKDIDYGYMICIFKDGTFMWYSEEKFWIRFMNYIPNVEVIGNIHENQDLLKCHKN